MFGHYIKLFIENLYRFVSRLLTFTSHHAINFVLKTVTLILQVSVFHPYVRKFEILKRKSKTALQYKKRHSLFSMFLNRKTKHYKHH